MRGFTLVELLIVLGILIIVSTMSVPFFQSFQTKSDLRTYTGSLTQTLRSAQQQAAAGQNNSGWGVYFDSGAKKFVLFKGSSYVGRDATYDLETAYPAIYNVAANFGKEIAFSAFSGLPSANGTTTVSGPNNESKNITISSLGLIQDN